MSYAPSIDPLAEVQSLVRRIGGDGGLVKARIRAASRALGWPPSRTKDLWYADSRCQVQIDELEKARRVAQAASAVMEETDLERLQRLEAEVAALRRDLAAALAGPEGASIAEKERGYFGKGVSSGAAPEGGSFSDRSLAQAYAPER